MTCKRKAAPLRADAHDEEIDWLPQLTVTQRNAYRLCCEYIYAFGAPEHDRPAMRILEAEDAPGDYARPFELADAH